MRIIFAALFLFLSSASHAADFYWKLTNGVTGSDPDVLCRTYVTSQTNQYGMVGGYGGLSIINPTTYGCLGRWQATNGTVPVGWETDYRNWSYVNRYGDSCPAGTTYNSAKGTCDAPVVPPGTPCDGETYMGMPSIVDSSGNCVSWASADIPATCKYLAGNQGTIFKDLFVQFQDGVPQKPDISYMGCEASALTVDHCTLPAARESSGIALVPNGANCKLAVSFTGNVSGDGNGSGYPVADPSSDKSGVCAEGQSCDPAEPPKVKESQPCTYVLDGEGRKVCSAFDFQADPGTMDCGTVNGSFSCITVPPKSTGQKIDTTVKTDTNADGSTKTTKTDTYTKVVCSGAGSCTTSSTTTVSVTGKSSTGEVTSQTSNCTGPDCTGTNTNDQNGDGVPDCQSDNSCDSSSPTTPELADVDDYQTTTQKFYDSVKASPLATAVSAISVPSGGAAPTLTTAPIEALGGAALDFSIIQQLKPVIDEVLSVTMKAFWCFVALLIFLSA